ncbi:MAG: ABC transporter permease [Clostridia bacterium]|nr:ABC transporter permease [Clostridia bacterium]
MLKFIIKRVLYSTLILFLVMFVIYTLMASLPSGYIEKQARMLSQQPGTQKSYDQWVEEMEANLGMDKGLVEGYFTWLGNAVQGDFGESWNWTVPVAQKFNDVVWYSFVLSLIAFVLEVAIAIPLGILAAKKQYSFADYTVTVVALVGISMPTFFLASLLKLVFSVKLGWFDIGGMGGRDHNQLDAWGQFLDTCHHMILPVITLTIIGIGGLMRYTRTNTLEVLNADYIRTARAKGLSEKRVIGYHAFRNTLIPIVTIVGGSLPGLFSGALITETLFDIRGIGFVSYHSMVNGDIPFTMFYLAFSSILILMGTLLSDILYAVVDPRVRLN